MPAHIGILDTLKIPFAALAQLGPGKFSKATRGMGLSTPAELYKFQSKSIDKRNTRTKAFVTYRYYLNRFDPNRAEPTGPLKANAAFYSTAVPQNEWDLYLKPGTTFDNMIKAVLAVQTEEWEVCFVSPADDDKKLKRIEIKRGKGYMSITLWSASHGANEQLL